MESVNLDNFFGIDARIEDIMDDYSYIINTISNHFEISLEDANDAYVKHLEEIAKKMHDNVVEELKCGKFAERLEKNINTEHL